MQSWFDSSKSSNDYTCYMLYLEHGGDIMNKEYRTDIEIKSDIKSAGKTFIAFRMADMLNNINRMDSQIQKTKLIEEYFDNQIGTFDKDIRGTTTRVNSLIRIIKADKVEYALNEVISSKIDSVAISFAKDTLRKIQSGEIKLPELI